MSTAPASPLVPGGLSLSSLVWSLAIFIAIDVVLYSSVKTAFTGQPSANVEVDQQLHKAKDRLDGLEQRLGTVVLDVSAERATIDRIARELEELKKTAPLSSDVQRLETAIEQLQSKLATGTSKK